LNLPQYKIASYIDNIFKEKKSGSFSVHSMFKKSINFSNGDSFFTVTNSEVPISPLNISVIDSDILGSFETKSVFNLAYPFLISENIKISFKTSEIVDTELESFSVPSIDSLREFKKDAVKLTEGKEGIIKLYHTANSDDILLERIRERVDAVRKSIEYNDSTHFESELQKLFGLGIGLTPSGDDFIYGLYAVLRTFNLKPVFAERIEHLIDVCQNRIGDISLNILNSLRDGHVYIPLKKLFRSLNSNKDCRETIKNLINYGSTSGSDIMAGVLFALESR
jgi:hypothetical protein